MTETQAPEATISDPWADVQLIEPETAKKATEVPDSILALADQIITNRSRDIVTSGWAADKHKDFLRFLRGAAEKRGVRFRTMATKNGDKDVLRVTVMATKNTAPDVPPAAPADATPPSPKGRGK